MKYSEVVARRSEIIQRELDITAELAENKRLWVAEKIETDFAHRITLEAELAQLAVEKNLLHRVYEGTKKAVKTYRHAQGHALLIKLLIERGLGDLVSEADRMAIDATEELRTALGAEA